MISRVSDLSSWTLRHLEASLLPVQAGLIVKAACYAYQFFKFTVFLPLAVATSTLSCILTRLFGRPPGSSLVEFARRPAWNNTPMEAAPVDIGFASSDFQENGPAAHRQSNWGQFYERNSEQIGPLGQMPDLWHHPEQVIERLVSLGVQKYRFSISRDKIEPTLGAIDQVAIQRYRNFCRELRRNGIEPMATLHHFTDPTYFSWELVSDIDGFVRYAETVSEILYEEGVRKIVTINEPTVIAFQGYIMGEFPPQRTLDFQGAGVVIENMMRAHTRVYHALKARHADFEIGISHDPIRFRNYHKLNPLFSPLEKIVCHYLTELNHGALMRFFQTGKFSFKVPFYANHTFEMPTRPPMDFIGLQYYSDPLLRMSLSGMQSVSRNPQERLTSYEYRAYPQGLASAIDDFASLGIPIDLTEIGIDIGFNRDFSDSQRIRYFDQIFQVVQRAIASGARVRSLYFWSLIDNLEWYRAWQVRFGFYSFDPHSGQITPRPVSDWLRARVANRNQRLANQAG